MRHRRKKNQLAKSFRLIVPVLFLLAILWVWKSTVARNLCRHWSSLENQKKVLIEDNKRLLAELEQYRSIGWIDSKVRQEFGMIHDTKNRMILLENQKTEKKTSVPRGFYAGVLETLNDIWRFLTGE
jgi:hypothetical protein